MTGITRSARTRLAIGGAAVAALLALSGCSGGMSTPDAIAPVAYSEYSAIDRDVLAADAGFERSIITTGWATILVDAPLEAATEATRIAERSGGRVESSSTNAPSEYSGGSASVTMRVPAARLDAVLEELAGLGTLQNSSTNSSDVTMQVSDLNARIGALESAIDRLTELLAEATTTESLIQIETAMTDRQAELDSLRAQQRYLDDQVAMSTFTVDFQTEPTEPKTGPDDFLGGVVAGWEGLLVFASGILVAAGVLLPWLIPIAVIAVIVWLIARAVRRRQPAAPAVVEPVVPVVPADVTPGPAATESTASETRNGWPVVEHPDKKD